MTWTMANQVVQILVQSGTISVNPTRINEQTILSVVVQELTTTVEPEVRYSNELRAGEV